MPGNDVDRIIEQLGLAPLEQEGGLFANTYVSETETAEGAAAGSAIYYLLRDNAFSHMHRLTGDEIYHFYLGDPVELLTLLPDGTAERVLLGHDVLHGCSVQHLVKAGVWQGSRLAPGGTWALLGTTMCPGYSDAGYEHGDRDALLAQYPGFARQIDSLTGTAVH